MILALVIALAPQQAPSFERGDPSGVVVDEQGTGIAGAEVTIARLPSQRTPSFELAIDQLLARAPLPKVTTRADGGFVLPLTRDQRRLGALDGDGTFVVRVTKAEFGPGFDRLDAGITGYLGSRIVLRRLQPEDRLEVQVEDVRPGMLLAMFCVGIGEPARVTAVPESGRFSVVHPLVSMTVEPLDTAPARGLWLMAQPLHPDCFADHKVVDPRDGIVHVPPARGTRRVRSVTRSDDQEIEGLRALYRALDGSEHSFALGRPEVRDSYALQAIAISAIGCDELRCSTSTELVLRPRGTASTVNGSACEVRVVDSSGAPVAGTTLRFSDSCYACDGLPEGVEVTGAGGALRIARLPHGAHFVTAIADGFVPTRLAFDHDAGAAPIMIVLDAADLLQVLTVDQGGRPVGGVNVSQHQIGAVDHQVPAYDAHTDTLGRAVVPVPRGGDWRCTIGDQQVSAGDPRLPLVRIVVETQVRTLVRIPHEELRAFEFCDGETKSSTAPGRPFFPVPPTALLVRAFAHPNGALSFGIIDEPPVRVTAQDLASGGAGLDRSQIVRRVPLVLPDKLPELRIVATLLEPNGDPDVALGNAAARAADGSWSFVARDHGEWRCLALASGYEPFSFTIPARAADGSEPPFRLALRRKP